MNIFLQEHSDGRSRLERYQAVVTALASALDARDEYAGRHSADTAELARRVAQRLRIGDPEVELVSQVAVLHDVGKLGVPRELLLKPGRLDGDEQALMREHPVIGQRILGAIPGLSDVAAAIRHEHERWDGDGYPDGLAGEQIPLVSRIVFACDAWQAMTSDRPYRPAMTQDAAVAELRAGAGSQFDPRVAEALLEELGNSASRPWCSDSPSETRDRRLSGELAAIARELGAEDLFVFRRVAGQQYSHLGGAGRGAGWAGNIELDAAHEHRLRDAIANGAPLCVELERTGRIVGPYYGQTAVIVPCPDDTVVVFGSSNESVAGACTDAAVELARRAQRLVADVSPAKRLADELEVLVAVREVTTVDRATMDGTLTAIATRARGSLSAEFAAVATIPSAEADWAIGSSAGSWRPADPEAASRALRSFAADASRLPLLYQDLSEVAEVPAGFRDSDGVSSIHVLPVGSPPVAVMMIAHAGRGPRGFTALCQRVAGGMSDAAELVIRRAIAQERLREENARLAEQLRTDALTGVASRSAWDEELHRHERRRRSEALSVVIVDVDGLKSVNDQAGHAAGDALLRRCAQLLAASVRSGDLVARIGGDEFGVLLRGADEAQVAAWCDRLDRAQSQGWSIGWASVPPAQSLGDAVAEADRRMYERKLARRVARS